MRTLVLSDVHGKYSLLRNALKDAGDWDKFVFLGDVCDIGTETSKCYAELKRLNAFYIIGNHELAHLIGEWINPYDQALDITMREKWKDDYANGYFHVMTEIEGIHLSHAGLSREYNVEYENFTFQHAYGMTIYGRPLAFSEYDLWKDSSPVWFRADTYKDLWQVPQIFGHTPEEYYNENQREDFTNHEFYLIDPYSRKSFHKPNYFKYAIIENGKVIVHAYQESI
jgi:hypothetical protein